MDVHLDLFRYFLDAVAVRQLGDWCTRMPAYYRYFHDNLFHSAAV
jgi:hypothetical protein